MTIFNCIDAPCGAGKSSYALQMIRERKGERFMFITPYLSELPRVIKACPEHHFIEPDASQEDQKDRPSKLKNLKTLLGEKRNIVSTHKLFSIMDDEAMEMIRAGEYTLILDEVTETLKPVGQSKSEELDLLKGEKAVQALLRREVLIKEPFPKDERCVRLLPGPEENLPGKDLQYYRSCAASGRLILVHGVMLLWELPPDLFEVFPEVWFLTYLWEASFQSVYCQLHDIRPRKLSVVPAAEGYALVDHDPELDRPFLAKTKELIRLYDARGKLNSLGISFRQSRPLSRTWYETRPGMIPEVMEKAARYPSN